MRIEIMPKNADIRKGDIVHIDDIFAMICVVAGSELVAISLDSFVEIQRWKTIPELRRAIEIGRVIPIAKSSEIAIART